MDKFFKITERGSTVKTEIIAGLTTFFAMAYIIVVNPNQLVGFSFDVPGVPKIWNAVTLHPSLPQLSVPCSTHSMPSFPSHRLAAWV